MKTPFQTEARVSFQPCVVCCSSFPSHRRLFICECARGLEAPSRLKDTNTCQLLMLLIWECFSPSGLGETQLETWCPYSRGGSHLGFYLVGSDRAGET